MFTYLAELHDKKMAAGQITGGPASQTLTQDPAAAVAATPAPAGATTAAAANSETVAVVELLGEAPQKGNAPAPGGAGRGPKAAAGAGGAAAAAAGGALPMTVELQPSKRRGKKTLGQRVSKAASKASRCYS